MREAGRRRSIKRVATVAMVCALCGAVTRSGAAADEVRSLKIKVLAGEGAFNDIKSRRGQRIEVQVNDQSGKPVAGATVQFKLPNRGAGGSFGAAEDSFTATTGAEGLVHSDGLRPNTVEGRFNIMVHASYQQLTADAVVSQSNTLAGGFASEKGHKKFWILALVGAAAAGGAVVATHHGSSVSSSSAPVGTTVSVGGITVGGPK